MLLRKCNRDLKKCAGRAGKFLTSTSPCCGIQRTLKSVLHLFVCVSWRVFVLTNTCHDARIRIYICLYIYIYTYIQCILMYGARKRAMMCIYIYTYIKICTRLSERKRVHQFKKAYTCTCRDTYIHAQTQMLTQHIYTFIYA